MAYTRNRHQLGELVTQDPITKTLMMYGAIAGGGLLLIHLLTRKKRTRT